MLLTSNLLGVIYSLVVLKTDIFKKYRIQTTPYKEGIFFERLPLYLLNLLILTILAIVGVYVMFPFFDAELPSFWVFAGQLLFITVIDDVWFYFMHRYLHENKVLLKKIHSIHHRAHTPFPLEYLYVHPVEWMLGSIGTFLGCALVIVAMPLSVYTFWAFVILRNLHEIHIHSDLKIPILKNIPLISPVEDHDVHHAKLNGNYASTFRIWDRIMNTRYKEENAPK